MGFSVTKGFQGSAEAVQVRTHLFKVKPRLMKAWDVLSCSNRAHAAYPRGRGHTRMKCFLSFPLGWSVRYLVKAHRQQDTFTFWFCKMLCIFILWERAGKLTSGSRLQSSTHGILTPFKKRCSSEVPLGIAWGRVMEAQ